MPFCATEPGTATIRVPSAGVTVKRAVIVSPDVKFVVLVGVKVAVMVAVPVPVTVAVVPETLITLELDDEYVKVPAVELSGCGIVNVEVLRGMKRSLHVSFGVP